MEAFREGLDNMITAHRRKLAAEIGFIVSSRPASGFTECLMQLRAKINPLSGINVYDGEITSRFGLLISDETQFEERS
jgi:hypothetical protein